MGKNDIPSLIPLLIACFIVVFMLLIPLKIVSYGFLPQDDALRHAAKVISQKNWDKILVLREEFKLDDHPGWHTILNSAHKVFGADQDGLVVFSIVALFFIFCITPVFLLRRPESWAFSLFIVSLASVPFMGKLFDGRPRIITSSILLIICLLWQKLGRAKFPAKITLFITFLIAFSTWLGNTWYVFALPIICFFITKECLAGLRLGIAVILGILLGVTLTGHPYLFLKQTLTHACLALYNNPARYNSVGYELAPFNGEIITVMVICFMLIWRRLRGAWDEKRVYDPIFILIVSAWILGFFSGRFWFDWGMPALCAWIAVEFQDILEIKWNKLSWTRLLTTALPVILLYLVITNSNNYFWMKNNSRPYLDKNNAEQAKLLPEPGGIIYNDSMSIFYDTFFKNPRAPWRYILGFEPAWMPQEDFTIFRNIQRTYGENESYEPWIKKMRPQDRLFSKRPRNMPPGIPELEWHYSGNEIWIGKLPAR